MTETFANLKNCLPELHGFSRSMVFHGCGFGSKSL
jgi:hypothetical protein